MDDKTTESSYRMDVKSAESSSRMDNKKTDKRVKFCTECSLIKRCKVCDKTFDRKDPLHSTSFHQLKPDLTNFVEGTSKGMIVDLGCPNSVISRRDVKHFITNLSKVQQDNLNIVQVDEKFKFGPSGPFQCIEKLQFPINYGSKHLNAEVAIVEVNIPMLLGNNFLKPLQAEIRLFASGNGVLRLRDLEIGMKETPGGHYIVKVKDLGKVCEMLNDKTAFCATTGMRAFQCEECGKTFANNEEVIQHVKTTHELHILESKPMKSILKHVKEEHDDHEVTLDNVLTDLNTLINGSKSKREKKLINTMKKLTKIQKHESKISSDICKNMVNSGPEFQNCRENNNTGLTKLILLSHHDKGGNNIHDEENDNCQIELDEVIWDVLLADDDSQRELSKEEEKELLKLHRYFAHRSGPKLWENLLQPAGRFKGKKKLIKEFLENCEVCRQHKKTPPKPKVGLPKSNDVNDVVSIDLKIMKKESLQFFTCMMSSLN